MKKLIIKSSLKFKLFIWLQFACPSERNFSFIDFFFEKKMDQGCVPIQPLKTKPKRRMKKNKI
jgi:hypothetical protein